nr:LacI family DNA-binding transcriptional regulator [Phytoactinopolyspora mesophila]
MKRVTIYAVAEACGVSASTVSRAFSRPEIVNDELRERILVTAREMGYQMNRAARGLATGRTGMVGLMVPDITNPFFPPLVRAIQQAAAQIDSSVMLVDADERASAEPELISRLKAQVDGLIIASPRAATGSLTEAVGGLPAVVINRTVPGMSAVVCDNSAALTEAGRHLQELGHRRVALIGGPAASWAARRRAAAIRAWAEKSEVELIELGSFGASYEGGREAAVAFAGSAATAAFAFDDLMACGVLAGLAEAGVPVPEARSVVGCDDVLLARTVTPNLTTVTAPVAELGRVAVDLLQQNLNGGAPEQIVLEGTLALRGTTGTPA